MAHEAIVPEVEDPVIRLLLCGAAETLHAGKAAMYIHGDWVKGYLDAEGWTPGVDYDQLPGPGNASSRT